MHLAGCCMQMFCCNGFESVFSVLLSVCFYMCVRFGLKQILFPFLMLFMVFGVVFWLDSN